MSTDLQLVADENRRAHHTYVVGNDDHRSIAARLGAGLSGRVTAGTSASPVSRRIAAQLAANPAGTARLLADIEAIGGAVTVLPTPRRTRRGLRLLAGGAIALALLATGGLTQAPTASAAVIPVRRPIVVVVAGPSARIDTDVVSTAAMFADGGHGVVLRTGAASVIGTSSGAPGVGAALVHVGGSVASRLLTPGTTSGVLTDLGDGRATVVPVQVLRQSWVRLDVAAGLPGAVLVTGRASHYDIATATFRGDQQSTVAVQVFVTGRWVTAATLVTAADGTVTGVVPAAPGRVVLRLIRQQGANVTGGVSGARATVALPIASARGDF